MEEHPQKESRTQRIGLSSLLVRLYRPGPLIFLFSVAFAALLGLAYHLISEETPPPVIVEEHPVAQAALRVYEEDSSSELEDKVKQADLAIIEAMKAVKMSMVDLDLLDVEMRKYDGKGYHYQVLQLPSVTDRPLFRKHLIALMAKRLPEADLITVDKNELDVSIDGTPTHRLLFTPTKMALPVSPEGPKMVVVIDDIGENMSVLKGLLKLDLPLTLAVWPHASHTRQAVDLITRRKRDLIVHFPMEPRGYPRYNPGDDALFVSMTKAEIERRVEENLASIPEAIGVNNHMGSRFTANAEDMQVALAAFKRHGLFFLDSLTSGKSVGRSVAKKVGIPFYVRNIFIDNVKDVSAIIHQLKKAENVALKKGHSIAIGHPYHETLTALRQWSNSRNASITLISLSQLKPE